MCDRNGNAVEWTKTVATNTSTNSSSCVNTNVNEKTIVKHPDVAFEKLDFPEDNIIEGNTLYPIFKLKCLRFGIYQAIIICLSV